MLFGLCSVNGEWVKRPFQGAPVVVFVHGVLSNGEACWRHPKSGFWPSIVADDSELAEVGVYVFSYKTGFFSGNYHLSDAVDALKELLKLEGILTPSGVVFVCHSMGGIVVRKYLVSRVTELIERDVPVALFLIASPSLGSSYANWLSPLARRLRHSQADALRFSQSNAWLNDLDREFLNMKEQRRLRLAGKELIEDQFVVFHRWWRNQVVQPFSGARYFGEPLKVPNSDHFSIAKVENGDTLQHRLLRQFIVEWRNGFRSPLAANADGGGLNGTPAGPVVEKAEVSFVLYLSADLGRDDTAGLDRLQDAIRTLAGSPRICVVEARAGSLQLFVSDPDGALQLIDLKCLRAGLLRLTGAELVGLTSIEAHEAHEARKEQIRELVAASGELLAWPTSLPNGKTFERPELAQLTDRMDGSLLSTTAVVGAAGSGKSSLLATLARSRMDAGWPVLAIKADLLEPDIVSEEMLGERLGLKRRPSVMLRELAESGPVVLVIDQLDALAGHLDVKTLRLSVLLNLVRAIGGTDNVHIVLSSRLFEFQHDVRLRSVGAESLDLELPSWTEVLAVLEAHGVAAAGWPPDAQQVMRVPQALATYLQLGSRHDAQPFASYQLMLDRMWTERVLDREQGGALDRLASDIADAMAEQESLWLATARFADRSGELRALVAAGILTTVDASVGFSHQTLFEFTLARSKAREPGRLSRLARDRQASLFLRPKLWAALTYLRGADRDLYHGELEAIWSIDLRPHLRALLIDFLGSQLDPTNREVIIIAAAMSETATRLRAYKAVTGSAGWFARLSHSHVARAMAGEEQLANAQIGLLTEAQRTAPKTVTSLICEQWLPNPIHDLRTWAVIQWSSPWTEEALTIALTVIARTDIAINMIDYQAATAAVEQPEAALRLVRAKLDRDLKRAAEERRAISAAHEADASADEQKIAHRLQDRARDPVRSMVEHGDDWDGLAGIAETWPKEFIDALWPWFSCVLGELEQTTARDRYIGYTLAHEADFRFAGENNLGLLESAMLGSLRVAVEGLADRDPEAFRRWVAENDAVALTPVQRLIAHGIAHRPNIFAADGLMFALGDERRYFLGSIHDMHGTIKRMVSAVSPFWSAAQVETFETRVREFEPSAPPEKTDPRDRMRWRHMARHTQLELLRALPKHQRSPSAERQVLEGERRYGIERRGAIFSGPNFIGSILEAKDMALARDEDIVNAFVELPDAVGWDNPHRRMAGGNVQLARAFADFAKEEPARALRILGQLDGSNGVRAAAYALDTLADGGDAEIVSSIARDAIARSFDGEEFRHSIARALDRLSRRRVPVGDDLIAKLEGWLEDPLAAEDMEAEDPDGEEKSAAASEDASAGRDARSTASEVPGIERSLVWGHGGFDIYPGRNLPIVDALINIRLLRGEHDAAAAAMSRFLRWEKGIRQWEVLSHYFWHLGNAGVSAGGTLLEKVLTMVPGVVGNKAFARLLATPPEQYHGLVERHLDAWRDSDQAAAVQAYGEIVALSALRYPEREDSRRRLDEIVVDGGTSAAQVGAALSAAHLLAEQPDRQIGAARTLAALLALPNPAVWPAAFEFFRLIDELTPDEGTIAFLRAISDGVGQSGTINPTFVVERLATMLPHEAGLVGKIALALAAKWKEELTDIRTAMATATSPLVDLAVTLHRLGPDTRDVGLELFEHLIDIDAYEARQALDEIDGRFRGTALQRLRPRLRRRSQVLPRRHR
ncbi:alpha/beta fold hydrolase [Roseomonas sp. ACRSG]|nr:alpha/beta fold hydrolase [Roseomonas sp. ACRSG]